MRSGGSQFSVYALMHNMKSHFNRSCLTSLALLIHACGFELRTYSAMFVFIFQDQFVFVNSHTTKFSTGILIVHFSFRFFSKGCVYGCNNDKERFAFFCHAALEFLLQGGFHPVSE